LQMDEPRTPTRPAGAFVDYYLKSDSAGPVTLEILDATSGSSLRTFSSDSVPGQPTNARAGRPSGLPSISPLWQQTPERFSAKAGMHRVVWNAVAVSGGGGGGGFGRAAIPLTGTFTARLMVNGKTYTQSFTVKPDPRAKS